MPSKLGGCSANPSRKAGVVPSSPTRTEAVDRPADRHILLTKRRSTEHRSAGPCCVPSDGQACREEHVNALESPIGTPCRSRPCPSAGNMAAVRSSSIPGLPSAASRAFALCGSFRVESRRLTYTRRASLPCCWRASTHAFINHSPTSSISLEPWAEVGGMPCKTSAGGGISRRRSIGMTDRVSYGRFLGRHGGILSNVGGAVDALQKELVVADAVVLEELACELLGRLTGVVFSRARSGSQRGGDGGVHEGGRHLIYQAKRLSKSRFDERALRGEIDQAVERDPDLESWLLLSTREVPEQTRTAMAAAGRPRGVHTMAIDWMPKRLPRLAALCASAPDEVEAALGKRCRPWLTDIARSEHYGGVLDSFTASLRDPALGYEPMRLASHARVRDIWANARTAQAHFGQDVAGGEAGIAHVQRVGPMAGLDTWWGDLSDKRDYDDPDDQLAARDFVDARVAAHFENRETFGFESTYSGISRPKAVRDAHKLGYAIRAFFLGTHNPVINVRRIASRVAAKVGHETAVLFDRISILDTSGETARVVVEFSAEQSAAPSVGRPAWAARLSARVAEARRTPVEPRSLP